MKKTTTLLAVLLFAAFQTAFATKYSIAPSGFTWSPATVNAVVGDTISIVASGTHPAVQVDQSTWNANGATPLAGGWGTKTATYTFVIAAATDIYYVCQNHVSMGMKGKILVTATGVNQVSAPSLAVSLFPNPVTNGEFTLKAEGYAANGKLLIYDTEGKLVETHSLTSVSTPIKSKLSSGVYFYDVIINSKPVYRSKFLMSLSK